MNGANFRHQPIIPRYYDRAHFTTPRTLTLARITHQRPRTHSERSGVQALPPRYKLHFHESARTLEVTHTELHRLARALRTPVAAEWINRRVTIAARYKNSRHTLHFTLPTQQPGETA